MTGTPAAPRFPGDAAAGQRAIEEVYAQADARVRASADWLARWVETYRPPAPLDLKGWNARVESCSEYSDCLLLLGDEEGAKAALAAAARWAASRLQALRDGGVGRLVPEYEVKAAEIALRVEDPQEWLVWREGVHNRMHEERELRRDALCAAAFACFRDGNIACGRRVVREAWRVMAGDVIRDATPPDTLTFWERFAREARACVIEGEDTWGEVHPAWPDDAAWARVCDPVTYRQRWQCADGVMRVLRMDPDFHPADSVRVIQRTVWSFLERPEGPSTAGRPDGAPGMPRPQEGVPPEGPVCCVVGATPEAMDTWVAHLESLGARSDTPAWLEDEPHELCCTWCAVEGRPVEIVVWKVSGSPPRRIPAREASRPLTTGIPLPGYMQPPGILDDGTLVAPFVTKGSYLCPTKAPVPAVVADAAQVLGERGRCAHASAQWYEVDEECLAFARLGCPECGRRAIAVCWLHHFPDAHPVWDQQRLGAAHSTPEAMAAWEDGYLRLWRATEVRNGRPDAVRTLAELRASDPAVPIDPSAYADRNPHARPATTLLTPRRRAR